MMKKIAKFGVIVGLLALTLTIFNWSSPAVHVTAEEAKKFGTISVTGNGEITIKPDVAYIQVGLDTTGKTAKESHEANAKQFAAITKALSNLKIAEKDIKTMSFNTNPDYEWTNNSQVLKGYRTSQMVQITYRNLDQLGTVLDAVAAAGANRVHGVQFGTENLEEYKLQALDKAMENARSKADRLVKHAGSKIHGVVSISEGGAYYQPIMYDNMGISYAAEGKAAPTQIYSGEIKVQASVSVTYSY